MQIATLGPLTVSRLCLGTMLMGGATAAEEAHCILDRFLEAGGTFMTPLTSTAMGSPSALWHRGWPGIAMRSCLLRRCASLSPAREARDWPRTESEPPATRASAASAWT